MEMHRLKFMCDAGICAELGTGSLARFRGRGIWSSFLAFICVVLLGGCTNGLDIGGVFDTDPDQHVAASDSDSSTMDDPILIAVATARQLKTPMQITDRQTGLIFIVVVHSEYYSASGRTCRRYNVVSTDSVAVEGARQIACEYDGVWRQVLVE